MKAAFDSLGAANRLEQKGFPREQAEELVRLVEEGRRFDFSDLATKADLDALRLATKADLDALRLATKADLDALRLATKADLDVLRLATKADIEALRLATKADLEALRLAAKADLTNAIELLRRDVTITFGTMLAAAVAVLFGLLKAFPPH